MNSINKSDKVIGEGKYGKVVRKTIDGKVYAVKYFKGAAANKEEIANEIKASKMANVIVTKGISPHFPRMYAAKTNIKQPYLITEYIDNSVSLYDLLKSRSLSNAAIQSITFQVMTAIYAMNVKAKFLHTDLHLNNILVKTVTPGGYWYYKIEGKYYKVPNTGYFIYVIDFGLAYKKKSLVLNWLHTDILKLNKGSSEKAIDYERFGQMMNLKSIAAVLPAKFKTKALPIIKDHASDNNSVNQLIDKLFGPSSSNAHLQYYIRRLDDKNAKVFNLDAKMT